jgi:glucan phosphoethanolaminetransferase (alkaline phosphatase superfamily)
VFHSVLGLMDVQTSVYRADRDLFAGCRRPAVRAYASTR